MCGSVAQASFGLRLAEDAIKDSRTEKQRADDRAAAFYSWGFSTPFAVPGKFSNSHEQDAPKEAI